MIFYYYKADIADKNMIFYYLLVAVSQWSGLIDKADIVDKEWYSNN